MTENQNNYGKYNYLSINYLFKKESIFCGGVAGISVDLVLFPLDTIKTRIQVILFLIKFLCSKKNHLLNYSFTKL